MFNKYKVLAIILEATTTNNRDRMLVIATITVNKGDTTSNKQDITRVSRKTMAGAKRNLKSL